MLWAEEVLRDVLTVTVEAIKQKLRGVETLELQALVRDSFRQAAGELVESVFSVFHELMMAPSFEPLL